MRHRCHNPKDMAYDHYHGNGIAVCEQWRDQKTGFTTFLADMGIRPKGKTLDRENPLLGYFPGNCRWATPKQQTENRVCMKTDEELAELQRLANEAASFQEEQEPF